MNLNILNTTMHLHFRQWSCLIYRWYLHAEKIAYIMANITIKYNKYYKKCSNFLLTKNKDVKNLQLCTALVKLYS